MASLLAPPFGSRPGSAEAAEGSEGITVAAAGAAIGSAVARREVVPAAAPAADEPAEAHEEEAVRAPALEAASRGDDTDSLLDAAEEVTPERTVTLGFGWLGCALGAAAVVGLLCSSPLPVRPPLPLPLPALPAEPAALPAEPLPEPLPLSPGSPAVASVLAVPALPSPDPSAEPEPESGSEPSAEPCESALSPSSEPSPEGDAFSFSEISGDAFSRLDMPDREGEDPTGTDPSWLPCSAIASSPSSEPEPLGVQRTADDESPSLLDPDAAAAATTALPAAAGRAALDTALDRAAAEAAEAAAVVVAAGASRMAAGSMSSGGAGMSGLATLSGAAGLMGEGRPPIGIDIDEAESSIIEATTSKEGAATTPTASPLASAAATSPGSLLGREILVGYSEFGVGAGKGAAVAPPCPAGGALPSKAPSLGSRCRLPVDERCASRTAAPKPATVPATAPAEGPPPLA
eukprot:jgi/Chrpa1/15341/Chrysochromulina_OHIO_Genome00000342-RA